MPRKTDTTEQVVQTDTEELNSMTTTNTASASSFDIPVFGQEMQDSSSSINIKFPLALFLNTASPPNHGLFLKAESLDQANWKGVSANHAHRFRQSKEGTPGLLFHGLDPSNSKYPVPRMNILRVSPTWIEISPKDGAIPLGLDGKPLTVPGTNELVKKGDIVGEYNFSNPSPLYEWLKGQGCATLRTFTFFYLLDEDNQPLHDIPFQLSARGAAARSFNLAYENWKLAYAKAYSDVTNTPLSFKWAQEFYALGVFIPTLGTDFAGEGANQSEVTVVNSFVRPTKENFPDLFLGKNPDRIADLRVAVEMTAAAAQRFLETNEFHRYLPGVSDDTLALNAGTHQGLPTHGPLAPSIEDVDDDGLPLPSYTHPGVDWSQVPEKVSLNELKSAAVVE